MSEGMEMIGLWLQGTRHVIDEPRPTGIFDVLGKAVWDSWKDNEGMPKYVA